MKLPPKTLHHPRNITSSDDVSEITMREEHEYSSSEILDYNDRASDDVSSANGSGGGSVNNGGGSVSVSGGGNKKSKNRLTKYLLKKKNVIKSSSSSSANNNNRNGASGSGGSSTNTGGSMGENKNEGARGGLRMGVRSSTSSAAGAAAGVTTVEISGHQLNNDGSINHHPHANTSNSNAMNNSNKFDPQLHYHPTKNSNNNSGQSIIKKSSSTTTVADQMVATMFSQSNTTTPPISTSGVERAKTWKNEAPYKGKERRVSIDTNTSSSQHSRGYNNNNNNNNMSSRRNHHDNMELTSSSNHSMEYSSMNVTKDRALGYRSEAVGAAAMVVEFGLNGGGNNNFRERSGSVEGVEKGMDMEQQRRRTVGAGEVGKLFFVFGFKLLGDLCEGGMIKWMQMMLPLALNSSSLLIPFHTPPHIHC